jgi:hypothetical protein
MENEATFVAPEGVYTVTEEHKPSVLPHVVAAAPPIYPTRVSTVVVKFPANKSGGGPGFAQLLGGNKESRKEKPKEKEDAISLSSSDSPEDDTSPTQDTATREHTLFAPTAAGKKRAVSRPKHNIRTTSSTFITRMQNAEGSSRILQSKQGDVTFIFYNVSKSFLWIEAGAKTKVRMVVGQLIMSNLTRSRWRALHSLHTRHATM